MTRVVVAVFLAACGATGSVPIGPPPPVADAGCISGDAAPQASPYVWTRSLQTPSLLKDMKRHASGDLILAGALEAALDNYDIHIPAPQRADPLVFRVDAKSGKLLWATTFATTNSNPSVANAVAVDGDDVFVAGATSGTSIAFGTNVVTFPPAPDPSTPARSFVAKLAAIDGSVVWGITFDANRTPYDANVDGECLTIVASAGEIDVGCNYVGAGFGYGGQVMKTAPLRAVAMVHLVDGAAPTLTRAKSYASDAPMTVYDAARSPGGDVYFLSTAGHVVTDLDGTPVLADAENDGIVGKLSPNGTITAIAPPVNLVIASRLHDEDGALVVTGIGVAKLDASLNLLWKTPNFAGWASVAIGGASGYYVARSSIFGELPPLIALDACFGVERASYTPITHASFSDPLITVDGLAHEPEGDLVVAGTYAGGLQFDDGTSFDTGYPPKSNIPWSDIYFARRPSF